MSEQQSDQPRDEQSDEKGDDQEERKPPRFNPLVFGVIAATIQMAIFLWLIYG